MPPDRRIVIGARIVALASAVHFLSAIQAIVMVMSGRLDPAHHGNPATLSLWAMTLSASWSFTSLLIALFALPLGAPWAIAAACVPIFLTGVPRVLTDPACGAEVLAVHGCHTFLGTELLALVGLTLVVSGVAAIRAERFAR